MKNSFFALLSRMKYIDRWALMRNTRNESLSEHTLETAYLTHALLLLQQRNGGPLSPEKGVVYALYHDCSEILTGDMPTPVKYRNQSIRSAYKDVEHDAERALLSRLPESMRDAVGSCFDPEPPYCPYLRAADKLSALIKCVEEQKAGNREFDRAYETILLSIRNLGLPEADTFLEEFLPAYRVTLDDL